jgi:uncharacterized integral membrane protein
MTVSVYLLLGKLLRILFVAFSVALIWVGLSNIDSVLVKWRFIGEWSIPLVLVMLFFFAVGWVVGLLSWLPSRMYLKKQLRNALHLNEEIL